MFILTVDTNEILSGGSDSDGHVDIVCFVFLGFCDRVKNFLISTQRYFQSKGLLLYISSRIGVVRIGMRCQTACRWLTRDIGRLHH